MLALDRRESCERGGVLGGGVGVSGVVYVGVGVGVGVGCGGDRNICYANVFLMLVSVVASRVGVQPVDPGFGASHDYRRVWRVSA